MIYKIVLKGLKPNAEEYEVHTAFITSVNNDIDGTVLAYMYEWRLKNGYHKVRYISNEVIPMR